MRFLLLFVISLVGTIASAAETYRLEESADDTRTMGIAARVLVTGQLETAVGDGKALALKLNVDAGLRYREHRLPGLGREAAALRSIREYEQAGSSITVHDEKTSPQLRPERRLIVAQGQREGVELYSPTGRLTADELELLRMPGDSLAILGLLPTREISVGESWNPQGWVIQMLTGMEAVVKSELTCVLSSVEQGKAKVSFQGTIEGATVGAASTVSLTGEYQYNVKDGYLAEIQMTQTEKRSVGAVSPGMEVIAKMRMLRSPVSPGALTPQVITSNSDAPLPGLLQLQFESPWKIGFPYDRTWHVFHQNEQVAILRLIEKGALIAQCNISPTPSARRGGHTSEQEFRSDIQRTLGDKLKSLGEPELLKTSQGAWVCRVKASGEVHERPIHWIYYLCADPSGRQVSLMFTADADSLELLGPRDLALVRAIEFHLNP